MKLSVIIPCYKFEKYIEECINSILIQKVNFEYEILVRDDGSNDKTVEIIQSKFQNVKNLRVLDSSTNIGVCINPVLLYKESIGEYIFYIDGDDYLTDENHIQRAVDFLEKNKEYVVYSSGYRYKDNDYIHPQNKWMCGTKKVVELKDLLEQNYISFARVFRKINFSNFDNFENSPYPDWNFNFQLLKHGLGYCDDSFCVGIYRLNENSVFSKKSDQEKNLTNNIIKNRLKLEYELLIKKSKMKVISIVDCFIHNQSIKNKLIQTLNWLNEDKHNILLISNIIIDKEILEKVDFYIFDKRNQLFEEKYTNIPYLDTFKTLDSNLEIHDISFNLQRHGLSVLINLFSALTFAKHQGYTHFQRFEVDDLYGLKSRNFIKDIPNLCDSNDRKGLFYYNYNNCPPDLSFHFFYCEIDYFLEKIKNIKCEKDYINYLNEIYGNKDFKIVEVFLYDYFKKNGDVEIFKKPGFTMKTDFSDTIWNTESSVSSIENKFKKCVTKLYKNKIYNKSNDEFIFNGEYTLLTFSYTPKNVERKIVVLFENDDKMEIYHKTVCEGFWQFHNLPSNIKSIYVYENDILLCIESKDDCHSYVVYR